MATTGGRRRALELAIEYARDHAAGHSPDGATIITTARQFEAYMQGGEVPVEAYYRDMAREAEAKLARVVSVLEDYIAPRDIVDEDSFNHGVDRTTAAVRAALGGGRG